MKTVESNKSPRRTNQKFQFILIFCLTGFTGCAMTQIEKDNWRRAMYQINSENAAPKKRCQPRRYITTGTMQSFGGVNAYQMQTEEMEEQICE